MSTVSEKIVDNYSIDSVVKMYKFARCGAWRVAVLTSSRGQWYSDCRGKARWNWSNICSIMTWISIITPVRNKGILADVVSSIYTVVETKRREWEFRGIDDLDWGITEVWFNDDSKPMAFWIPTQHVEIKGVRRDKVPGRSCLPFNSSMVHNTIRECNSKEWWYVNRIMVEEIWRPRQ